MKTLVNQDDRVRTEQGMDIDDGVENRIIGIGHTA